MSCPSLSLSSLTYKNGSRQCSSSTQRLTPKKQQYGDAYTASSAINNVSSIAFAGTIVGQLLFGVLADKWSRVNTLLVSTVILIVFTALAAGSYWHGETAGLLAMLVAW